MLHLCRSYGASLGHRHAASSVTHAIALAWRALSTDVAERTVDFGYRQVPEGKKEGMVGGVFTSVAGQYDLMNDLMSAGLHRLWKDRFVQGLGLMPGMTHLDVAGGTGDIAFRSVRILQAAEHGKGPGSTSPATPADSAQGRSRVVVLDLNEEMLKHGQQRLGLAGAGMLEWVHGNAEELPLSDGSVDVYTCAFGIRNVTHIDRALAEAHRVLKRGGSFSCLEFSRVRNPVLQQLYDSYSFLVIPQLGRLVANDRDSYTYLVESIRKFPPQEEFAAMIRQAGFKCVTHQDLTAGVVAIHTAVKL